MLHTIAMPRCVYWMSPQTGMTLQQRSHGGTQLNLNRRWFPTELAQHKCTLGTPGNNTRKDKPSRPSLFCTGELEPKLAPPHGQSIVDSL
jgi:hypothetical protein